ncbi:MAG: L-aspartate oxidase [Armatimonadota bacterium]|nr:L-aspartate oxidase [Armatimonadota bacterium]
MPDSLTSDYLVVGSGIAGLTFALRCAPHGRVVVVTKAELANTNTSHAQGGIAAAVGEGDSLDLHVQDTLTAGAGLCDVEAVKFLVGHAADRLRWLIDIGAQFDKTDLDVLSLGLEGGHSRKRIVRRADQTGWEIERALTAAVRNEPNIRVIEYGFAEALLTGSNGCSGALVHVKGSPSLQVTARATCLATGSCCRVYRFTTNPPIATGDGVALAATVGAQIENMEFIQFHPTTLYHREKRGFLITEAARGEGAILRSINGRRFMYDYDDRGELAPRDIVARAIHAETQKSGVPFVHLDMTHIAAEKIHNEFPFISETLSNLGIDLLRDPIPVVPAAHYQCGGVKTDLDGKTTVSRLYAAGEVACTGVHGANRLASNSLLEAVVFGWSAAEHAISSGNEAEAGEPAEPPVALVSRSQADGIARRLKRTMWDNVGIVRRNRGIQIAADDIAEMIEEIDASNEFYVAGAEIANLLECGKQIVKAATKRSVNVGLHYNADLGPLSESDSLPMIDEM